MDSRIVTGSTVEYESVGGLVHTQVLKIKEDGKLILHTKGIELKVINPKNATGFLKETVSLCKNVCIMPHRVKFIK